MLRKTTARPADLLWVLLLALPACSDPTLDPGGGSLLLDGGLPDVQQAGFGGAGGGAPPPGA
ncbi:MAG: hypothetical protein KC549_02120, partial [Myxococcales bacterium]|nr:hypothetical protein [Myxococcales bacterium]